MVSGLVKAGMALGAAQGRANKMASLQQAIQGLGKTVVGAVKDYRDDRAGEQLAQELGIDQGIGRAVGPERMFGLLAQQRMNDAYSQRQSAMLEQKYGLRAAEAKAKQDFAATEEEARLKNMLAGLRASGAQDGQMEGLGYLAKAGVTPNALLGLLPKSEGDIEPTTEYRNFVLGQRNPDFAASQAGTAGPSIYGIQAKDLLTTEAKNRIMERFAPGLFSGLGAGEDVAREPDQNVMTGLSRRLREKYPSWSDQQVSDRAREMAMNFGNKSISGIEIGGMYPDLAGPDYTGARFTRDQYGKDMDYWRSEIDRLNRALSASGMTGEDPDQIRREIEVAKGEYAKSRQMFGRLSALDGSGGVMDGQDANGGFTQDELDQMAEVLSQTEEMLRGRQR